MLSPKGVHQIAWLFPREFAETYFGLLPLGLGSGNFTFDGVGTGQPASRGLSGSLLTLGK